MADPSSEHPIDDVVLRLHAEQLEVVRRTVETGSVRVAVSAVSHDHLVDEAVTRVDVIVEHVPIGRVIDQMPETREEGDLTIIPVVEEIVVVERRLVLREEIHIRRVKTVHRHQETIPVRREDVTVERTHDTLRAAVTGENLQETGRDEYGE